MKVKKINQILILVLSVALMWSLPSIAIDKDDIQQIQQAILQKGANWTAGESWVTQLSPEEQRELCGDLFVTPDPADARMIELPKTIKLPVLFDWRDNNGNWVTPVTNQLDCGSCWAFSAVAQVESWWKIVNTNLDSMIDLSEQFVLSCSDGTCGGWYIGAALDFIKENGLPLESCMPYKASDDVLCSSVCSDWQDHAITIPGWGYITAEEANVENIKNALLIHPVSARYDVYEDFMSYRSGVYQHVWGGLIGGHAVLIVGWDDANECWIVKNSWGQNWGESGYFRIKWGDSNFGIWSPFIWDEFTGESAFNIEKPFFNLSLTIGDSVTHDVTISNSGSLPLFYAAMKYQVDLNFHPSSYNAFDGLSWWCGSPAINGYGDHWLDFLDTPELDLSGTNAPKLEFQVNWSIENPKGAESPYDGWDGCNVMLSNDGGNSFQVIEPITPAYTVQSLWSFGHPEQGWDYGPGIAGWAGSSNGWQPAEFDLSAYKNEKIIIRFAFASDLAYSTPDDPNLKGFFVDNILVTDGTSVIFENNGDNYYNDMKVDGFSNQRLVDWLSLSQSAGLIPPQDSASISITVNTRQLLPGDYNTKIVFSSNDSTAGRKAIALNFNLARPEHDIGITQVWLPGGAIPILFPIEPGAEIVNAGLNDEADFTVICQVADQGQPIYSDTVFVASLLTDQSKVVTFKPLMLFQSGELEFNITLENLVDDYNAYNNSYRSISQVSNLVDNFESATGFWKFEGGWGITNQLQGRNSQYAAHVNNGNLPYENNMNATMTFIPGFDVSAVDELTLTFWTRYVTEADKDICYVEASGNQTTWTKLDSLSGFGFTNWSERIIPLTNLVKAGYQKVWVRFRFVSNESIGMAGVLIDDVSIYPDATVSVKNQSMLEPLLEQWQLLQNYPNPFNLNTTFSYNMVKSGDVKLSIYNINGKLVRDLLQQKQSAGLHSIDWDGRDNNGQLVGTGIYLYRLEVKGKFMSSKKMILLK